MFDAIVVPRGPEERAVTRGAARAGSATRILAGGIGPRAAAFTAEALLRDGLPAKVLVTGLCGALSPSLLSGDVLVYATIADSRGAGITCDQELSERAARLLPGAQSGIRGVSSDTVVTRLSEKRSLREIALADAVDMESYALAARLQRAGVKVAIVRVASDGPADELPDLNRALDDSGGLSGFALLGLFFSNPRAGARLAANGWRALQRLSAAIAALA